jgi:hypothetical protein
MYQCKQLEYNASTAAYENSVIIVYNVVMKFQCLVGGAKKGVVGTAHEKTNMIPDYF